MPRRVSRLLLVALGFSTITFVADTSLHGQRAGSVGHMGVASHGSPSLPSAPRSFAPQTPASRGFALPARGALSPQNHHQNQHQSGQWPASANHRPEGNHRGGVGYPARYPYVYAGYPGLLSFGYGLPFGYGSDIEDDSAAQAAPPPPDYGNEPPLENPPEVAASETPIFRPAYQPQLPTAPMHAQPATTLIFSNGQSLQVHNYALTGSTLYALDGETRREIPLSELNVPATIDANRKSGVDFALPTSR